MRTAIESFWRKVPGFVRALALAMACLALPACSGSDLESPGTSRVEGAAASMAAVRDPEIAAMISNPTGNVGPPQIAADGRGNAVAVWVWLDPETHLWDIQASRYAHGRWRKPVSIGNGPKPTDDYQVPYYDYRVAMDGAGSAVAVWTQAERDPVGGGIALRVFASRAGKGGNWGKPVQLSNPALNGAMDPDVAVDPAGNAVVVWVECDFSGDAGGVYASVAKEAGAFGPATFVGTGGFPSVVATPGGTAVAAWWKQGEWTIQASRYASGTWGTPVTVGDGGHGGQAPQLASDARGNVVAVWDSFTYPPGGIPVGIIFAAHCDVETFGWGPPVSLSGDAAYVYGPRLAMDGRGNAFAVWYGRSTSDGNNFSLFSSNYDSQSGSWTGHTITSGGGSIADVACDPDGNAVALWTRWESAGADVCMSRCSGPSGAWSQPVALVTPDPADASGPQVAYGGNGLFLSSWAQSDGTWSRNWAMWFN